MFFKDLKLLNFKNYETVHLEFHPKVNVIYGMNGVGKTNILDALHFLSMVKSNFHQKDLLAVQNGKNMCRVEANLEKDNKAIQLVLKFLENKGKELSLNKKVYERFIDHIGLIPVVFSAPKDIHLLTGSSADRRNLLDRVLSQLDRNYLLNLALYKNLLKQRNALLKQGVQEKSELQNDLLVSYSERMSAPAIYIFRKRQEFIDAFEILLKRRYKQISKGKEQISCSYVSQLQDYSFEVWADKNSQFDILSKRTNAGVHKDDLIFYLDQNPAKEMASQGQLKSLILSLKFALYDTLNQEKNDLPILLLDDIFAKLDRERIYELIHLLVKEQMGQIFITDTDSERIEVIMKEINVPYRKFEIENGSIKIQEDVRARI